MDRNKQTTVPASNTAKLPQGWSRHVVKRLQGRSEGKLDIYVYNPEGKKFRSKNEITAYLKKAGINNIDVDVFDFSTRNTTVVIPKGVNIIKPPLKRKVESPSPVLTKKQKVETISNISVTKTSQANTPLSKTATEMRVSLSKFATAVKLIGTNEPEEDHEAELSSEHDCSSMSAMAEECAEQITSTMASTDISASNKEITLSPEVPDEILLTVEEVRTESTSADQRVDTDDELTLESMTSEQTITMDDDSTCQSNQSVNEDLENTQTSTSCINEYNHLLQPSINTITEDESDASEHFDETPLRLAMLKQMTALRRDSDISSDEESTVDSTTSEQATQKQENVIGSALEEITNNTVTTAVVACMNSVIKEQMTEIENMAKESESVDGNKFSSMKNDEPSPMEAKTPTCSDTIKDQDYQGTEFDITEEQAGTPNNTEDKDDVQNKSTAMIKINVTPSEKIETEEDNPGVPEILEMVREVKSLDIATEKNSLSYFQHECNISKETESDFVNEMLLPDNINIGNLSGEREDVDKTVPTKEIKSEEEKDVKIAESSSDSVHGPFETEHTMVKNLLENNDVHLYKPALSEKIEEMLTDIDQEPDEINQEAFVLKLGLEKIKEDSNGFESESSMKAEDVVDTSVPQEGNKVEEAEANTIKQNSDIITEVVNLTEESNEHCRPADDLIVAPCGNKEMPDLINIDEPVKVCEEMEREAHESSFEMPDIINIEKPSEDDGVMDDEIKMPELEPMVLTEVKKVDDTQQQSLQKRVLIEWSAIQEAVEEDSDSDCSSSIESFESYNKTEDESSSSNGDASPSKKLKLSPYFRDSSDSKKNIIKCRYFKTSDNDETSDVKDIIKSLNWVPPKSPYNLIQESLYQEPWKLLIATIFLNRTSGKVAIPLVWKFFDRWATPEAAYSADKDELAKFLQPMGLNNRRAEQIMRFSYEFKHKSWLYPKELFGISKYGNDSFRIFCRNEWRKVKPLDHKLNMYHNWLCQNWKALGI